MFAHAGRLIVRCLIAGAIRMGILLCHCTGYCGDYKRGYYCERARRHAGPHYAQDRGYRVCW